MVLFARILALPVSLVLIWWLASDADYRSDNIFALPDLAFSLLLVVAAFLPRRAAVPLLTVGFYFGSGVITVAAFERLAGGDTGPGVLNFAIAALYLATALVLSFKVGLTSRPAPQP
ncbi:hypothetical protein [Glycomyces sp. NRRL B-16210]|uniref:hypothetical protein n=1 Tax=Glycomyces sp. NRRL B-16210 TaxID=1463821 RepID=UPI0004C11548|nr:hypothetical protein [Glycomyces sp. NRRL B-16210]